jgi:virginiamycin B lyase
VPWITDSGLNAILSVDPVTDQVTTFALPDNAPDANLNTAAFDGDGTLWFTGQSGFYGFVIPDTSEVGLFPAPEGAGPYGIAATPDGTVYYASLAGSHIARIEPSGELTVVEPPTPEQGARRVWSDSTGGMWVSEWNAGNLSRYRPDDGLWDTFPLPGEGAQPYAVYVDEHDMVWASDFTSNSMIRLDPVTGAFDVFPLPHEPGNVRQILGRPGEVWAGESAADSLLLIRDRRP